MCVCEREREREREGERERERVCVCECVSVCECASFSDVDAQDGISMAMPSRDGIASTPLVYTLMTYHHAVMMSSWTRGCENSVRVAPSKLDESSSIASHLL